VSVTMCHEPGSSVGPAYSFAYETSHLLHVPFANTIRNSLSTYLSPLSTQTHIHLARVFPKDPTCT